MASTSSVGLLIVVLVIVVLGAISVALIAVGLRGRRIHDRPVCARCRFDVSGLVVRAREANDLATRRCPECGADLARAGAVRQGLRQRRRVPLAFGILLLLMIVSVGVLAMTSRGSHAGVAARLPTSALVGLSRFGADDAYLIELAARVTAGETSAAENASLAARVLTRMSDGAQGWSSGWDTMLLALYGVNSITDSDLDNALRNTLTATLRTRDKVRATGYLTYVADVALPPWRSPTTSTVGIANTTAVFRTVDGSVVATLTHGGHNLQSGRMLSSGAMGSGVRVPDLAPGVYNVDLTVALVAGTGARGDTLTFPIEMPIRLTKRIEVVAADQSLVTVLDSPEQERQIRGAIASIVARAEGKSDAPYISATVTFKELPMVVAYRVYAKAAGAPEDSRFDLGSFVAGASEDANIRRGFGIGGQPPPGFDAKAIDLIFEPDATVAERSVEFMEISGATLRVDGVAVDWSEVQPTAP